MRKCRLGVGLVMSMALACAAADQVRLTTGEVLTGTVITRTESAITFRHPILGDLVLRPEHAEVIPPPPEAQPPRTAEPPGVSPAPPPPPASFWQGWTRRVALGVNGASGNSENFSGRGVLGTRRKTETAETAADVSYIYTADEGEKSKSRGEANARHDWFYSNSRWGLFALGKLEYDEFQDWDWRFSGFVGPSFAFIKTDRTMLRGRAGLGISYELGGDHEEINPEAMFGFDFERAVNARSKWFVSAEYLPSLSDAPEFRANAKAGYEILLDEVSKMSLKLGVADRYDSDPGPLTDANDIEYFVLLGWEF